MGSIFEGWPNAEVEALCDVGYATSKVQTWYQAAV
jgi:hypothetical protein